jgi:hypothetical protein
MVGTDGIITTVADNGTYGFSGDGGRAREASLDRPLAVATAGNGDIYIADTGNRAIRRVHDDTITPIAGRPWKPATPLDSLEGDGGPAASAKLMEPIALAVNPKGEIFVGDGARIRAIKPAP